MRIAFLALVALAACGSSKPAPAASERSAAEPAAGGSVEPSPPAEPNAGSPPDAPPAAPKADVTPATPKAAPPACAAQPNPAGCPQTEPNINARCKKNGLACTYGTSCCPPVYVCHKLKFEARFQSCPK